MAWPPNLTTTVLPRSSSRRAIGEEFRSPSAGPLVAATSVRTVILGVSRALLGVPSTVSRDAVTRFRAPGAAAGAPTHAPGWKESGQELGHGLAACGAQRGRVGRGLGGDGQPGEPHGDGEGDPVGIDPAVFCGVRLRCAQCLVDGEEGVNLLADQLGRLGTRDESGAAQAVLQFREPVFDLPPLVICRSRFYRKTGGLEFG